MNDSAPAIPRKDTSFAVDTYPRLPSNADIGEVLGKILHRAATMQTQCAPALEVPEGMAPIAEKFIITATELVAIRRWFEQSRDLFNPHDHRRAYVYLVAQMLGIAHEQYAPRIESIRMKVD